MSLGGSSRFLKSKSKDPFQKELSDKIESRNRFHSTLLSDSDDDEDDLLSQYSKNTTMKTKGASDWQPGMSSSKSDSTGLSQYMSKTTEKEKPQPEEEVPPSQEELIFGKEAVEKQKIKEAKKTKVYQPPSYSRKFDEDDEEDQGDKSTDLLQKDNPMPKGMDSRDDPMMMTMGRPGAMRKDDDSYSSRRSVYDEEKEKTTSRGSSREKLNEINSSSSSRNYSKQSYSSKERKSRYDDDDNDDDDNDEGLFGSGRKKSSYNDMKRDQTLRGSSKPDSNESKYQKTVLPKGEKESLERRDANKRSSISPRDSTDFNFRKSGSRDSTDFDPPDREAKRRGYLKSSSKSKFTEDISDSAAPKDDRKASLMDFITDSNESKYQKKVLSKSEKESLERRDANKKRSSISPRDSTDFDPPQRTSNFRKSGSRDSTDFDPPDRSNDFRKSGSNDSTEYNSNKITKNFRTSSNSSSSLSKPQPVPKQRSHRVSSPDRSPETSLRKEKEIDSGRQSPDIILPGDPIRPPKLPETKVNKSTDQGRVNFTDEKERPESPSSFCEELERDPRSIKEEEYRKRKENKRRKREFMNQTKEHQEDSNAIYKINDAQEGATKSQSAREEESTSARKKKKTMTSTQLFSQVNPKIQTRLFSARSLRRSESLGDNMNYTDSNSIRDSVYEQWYIKRLEEDKKKRKEEKKKQEEEKKIKREKELEKQHDRELAFKCWSDSKKDFQPSYKKKEKQEQKQKEKEEKEQKEKKEDAKKAFEKWAEQKKEKDKELISKKRKEKRTETEKEKENNAKKKDAENAYESWNKKKKEKLNEDVKDKRLKQEGDIAEKRKIEEQKMKEAREAFLQWEMKKRENDTKHEENLHNSTYSKKPWRPSSANGPKRVPMGVS